MVFEQEIDYTHNYRVSITTLWSLQIILAVEACIKDVEYKILNAVKHTMQ